MIGKSPPNICRNCLYPLTKERYMLWLADGCSCNSRRGINHGLVPENICTCKICDPNETGSVRSNGLYK